MERAVAYIRVSTKEQDENVQKLAIEKFAKEKGIEVIKYFVDKGVRRVVSWMKRDGAAEMINFLSSGGKDIVRYVIVFDFTRLGYNLRDIFSLFDKLEKELGVKIMSVKDTWLQIQDENIRDLLIRIFSWLAEMELRLRRERQLAAWEAGKQKGRPPKVSNNTIIKYLKRYDGLSIRAIWKIMRSDGIDISYDQLRRRIKKLGYTIGLRQKESEQGGGVKK
ncbi:MAG: recombinase family protein [Candidatus Njordarchaeota archaeon]